MIQAKYSFIHSCIYKWVLYLLDKEALFVVVKYMYIQESWDFSVLEVFRV